MDPLAAFAALAADVHHAEDDVVEVEWVFDDASRGHTHAQDVLKRRQIVSSRNAVQSVQVAVGANCLHMAEIFIIILEYAYVRVSYRLKIYVSGNTHFHLLLQALIEL